MLHSAHAKVAVYELVQSAVYRSRSSRIPACLDAENRSCYEVNAMFCEVRNRRSMDDIRDHVGNRSRPSHNCDA